MHQVVSLITRSGHRIGHETRWGPHLPSGQTLLGLDRWDAWGFL